MVMMEKEGNAAEITISIDNIKSQWQDTVDMEQSEGVSLRGKASSQVSLSSDSTSCILQHTIARQGSTLPDNSEFELMELIGKGGMGTVYAAKQTSMDRRIALKLIQSDHAENESSKCKFISEALVTGELDHPNIVPTYELGRTDDGGLFYSMKEVVGADWGSTIEDKSESENIDILMGVCNAIAFAHDQGYVYRDLKPGNVMLGEYG